MRTSDLLKPIREYFTQHGRQAEWEAIKPHLTAWLTRSEENWEVIPAARLDRQRYANAVKAVFGEEPGLIATVPIGQINPHECDGTMFQATKRRIARSLHHILASCPITEPDAQLGALLTKLGEECERLLPWDTFQQLGGDIFGLMVELVQAAFRRRPEKVTALIELLNLQEQAIGIGWERDGTFVVKTG